MIHLASNAARALDFTVIISHTVAKVPNEVPRGDVTHMSFNILEYIDKIHVVVVQEPVLPGRPNRGVRRAKEGRPLFQANQDLGIRVVDGFLLVVPAIVLGDPLVGLPAGR